MGGRWSDGQCRTVLNLHRWGVRERREEMEVKTCTDQKCINGRKRDTYYPDPSSGSSRDAKLERIQHTWWGKAAARWANRSQRTASDSWLARHKGNSGRLFGCLGLVEDCERCRTNPRIVAFQVVSQSLVA
jgi:hypothetical protein